jgi:hypothetical protein
MITQINLVKLGGIRGEREVLQEECQKAVQQQIINNSGRVTNYGHES